MTAKRSLIGRNGFTLNVLFADGSVHFIKDSINPITYRSLATRALGELISADSY